MLRRASLAFLLVVIPYRASVAQVSPLVNDSLRASLDSWIRKGLQRYEIAGAAIAVVEGGKLVHLAGFGVADIARRTPMSAEHSVFHIASVTKLITAIAALQEVDAGRMTLDADARPWIGVAARSWPGTPVTLRQLLTHMSGLDMRWIGMATDSPAGVRPLDVHLQRFMPPAIDVPGTRVRYSNYGYAAVGRAVEATSGIPWNDVVTRRILRPLGMTSSYANVRAPKDDHVVGYRYRADTTPEPAVFEHVAPAGAVHATASDLAALMTAILDSTNTTLSLSQESRRLLLSPAADIAPGVHGYAFGTFEFPNSQAYAATTGGEVPGFSTRLLFVPERNFGVVIMVNRKDPTLAVDVFDSLMKRLPESAYTHSRACIAGPNDSDFPVEIPEGRYRPTTYDHGSFLRIGAALGATFEVSSSTPSGLMLLDPIRSRYMRWTRAGPRTWATEAGECLGLVDDQYGSVLAISTGIAGPIMLERVPAWESQAFAFGSITAAIVLLIVAALFGAVRSRRDTLPRALTAMTAAVVVGQLAFVVAFAVGLYLLAIAYDDRFAFGLPVWFRAVLLLPVVLTVLTAATAVLSIRAWRNTRRIPTSPCVVVAASAILLAFSWAWSIPG